MPQFFAFASPQHFFSRHAGREKLRHGQRRYNSRSGLASGSKIDREARAVLRDQAGPQGIFWYKYGQAVG